MAKSGFLILFLKHWIVLCLVVNAVSGIFMDQFLNREFLIFFNFNFLIFWLKWFFLNVFFMLELDGFNYNELVATRFLHFIKSIKIMSEVWEVIIYDDIIFSFWTASFTNNIPEKFIILDHLCPLNARHHHPFMSICHIDLVIPLKFSEKKE